MHPKVFDLPCLSRYHSPESLENLEHLVKDNLTIVDILRAGDDDLRQSNCDEDDIHPLFARPPPEPLETSGDCSGLTSLISVSEHRPPGKSAASKGRQDGDKDDDDTIIEGNGDKRVDARSADNDGTSGTLDNIEHITLAALNHADWAAKSAAEDSPRADNNVVTSALVDRESSDDEDDTSGASFGLKGKKVIERSPKATTTTTAADISINADDSTNNNINNNINNNNDNIVQSVLHLNKSETGVFEIITTSKSQSAVAASSQPMVPVASKVDRPAADITREISPIQTILLTPTGSKKLDESKPKRATPTSKKLKKESTASSTSHFSYHTLMQTAKNVKSLSDNKPLLPQKLEPSSSVSPIKTATSPKKPARSFTLSGMSTSSLDDDNETTTAIKHTNDTTITNNNQLQPSRSSDTNYEVPGPNSLKTILGSPEMDKSLIFQGHTSHHKPLEDDKNGNSTNNGILIEKEFNNEVARPNGIVRENCNDEFLAVIDDRHRSKDYSENSMALSEQARLLQQQRSADFEATRRVFEAISTRGRRGHSEGGGRVNLVESSPGVTYQDSGTSPYHSEDEDNEVEEDMEDNEGKSGFNSGRKWSYLEGGTLDLSNLKVYISL